MGVANSFAQLKRWEHNPLMQHLQLSVNVSARQFRQPDFVEHIQQILHQAGANPALLKLELTESLVMGNLTDTVEKMQALQSIGVRFSLDDFGRSFVFGTVEAAAIASG